MKRRLIIVQAVALLLLALASCSAKPEKSKVTVFAMDTVIYLEAYGEGAQAALDEAAEKLYFLDELLSATKEDSEISKINKSAGSFVPISDEVIKQLEAALEVSRRSGGAFDVSVLPLVNLWGFGTEGAHVPAAEEIEAALQYVDYGKIGLEGSSVRLAQGMSITLGAIAKGYASQELSEMLKGRGISSAILSLGGNVQAIGSKPDGLKWRVALRDPVSAAETAGVFELSDMAAVTSGGYERYFEQDGKVYHHILDPKTGYPAEGGLISVTIVCDNGMTADALSTALFVLGEDKAIEYWRDYGGFAAVLITDDGRMLVTEGLRYSFKKSGESYSLLYVTRNGGDKCVKYQTGR